MKTVFTLFLFNLFAAFSFAQPGALDSSFGHDGKVVSQNYTGAAYTSIIQPDGKIVIGGSGTYYKNDVLIGGSLLARYNTDGSLDLNFADSGRGVYILGDTGAYIPVIHAMTLEEDGKILALGSPAQQNGQFGFALMRFNIDGSADKSFGINGMAISEISGGDDVPYDVALLPDGRIIVVGDLDIYGNTLKSFVACYTSDGHLDKNFGNNGIVTIYLSAPIHVKCAAITNDNKIIVSGAYWSYPKNFVFRYNSDGTSDLTFGKEGIAEMQFEKFTTNTVNDMAISDDQKIAITGVLYLKSGKATIVVSRFTQDGKPDSSFGTQGYVYTAYNDGNSNANALAIQKNNKIIATGYFNSNGNTLFTIIRYNEAGTMDSSFGINGIQNTNFFGDDISYSINIQKDGKIISAGYSEVENPEFQDIVDIARYNGDLTQKQILIAKIRHWIQHHNGFIWDANNNISSYVVQRSYDGIHFSSIAKINANNNSNYTYQDPSPLSGSNYYRLQTTSINGSINYSNVLAVSNNNIKISPNPATNSLQIQGLPSNQKTKITIVDFNGYTKMQTVVNNTSYNLNIASLKAGNYLLKIEMNDDVITKQFVKE